MLSNIDSLIFGIQGCLQRCYENKKHISEDAGEKQEEQTGRMNNSKQRYYYIDIIKATAIIMVLFNHRYMYQGITTADNIGFLYFIKLFLAFACKMGAALFLMASGVLLINGKDATFFKEKDLKRILRILIVMILFSCVLSYKDFCISNIWGNLKNGLNWYLYAYLAFLLMLPFFRKTINYLSNHEMIYFIVAVFILFYAEGIFRVNGIENPFWSLYKVLPLMWGNGSHGSWHIIYPLIGAFTEKLFNEKSIRRHLWIVAIIGSIASTGTSMYFCTVDLMRNGGENCELLRQDYIVMPCILFYLVAREYSTRIKNGTMMRIVTIISQGAFGVFLLETCSDLQKLWLPAVKEFLGKMNLSQYVSGLIQLMIALVIYLLVTYLLKCIPGIKKIL